MFYVMFSTGIMPGMSGDKKKRGFPVRLEARRGAITKITNVMRKCVLSSGVCRETFLSLRHPKSVSGRLPVVQHICPLHGGGSGNARAVTY